MKENIVFTKPDFSRKCLSTSELLCCWFDNTFETRRERLKSALYLRLKKAQFFKFVKGGPFRLFENPVCCKISKKLSGDHLETFEKYKNIFGKIFEKKRKTRFLKQSHRAEKLERGPFGLFENPVCCKISKGDPLATKKFRKKVAQCRKKLKESHSAEKNCSKKFLAKARTRTRDRWVHRKPSTDEYM